VCCCCLLCDLLFARLLFVNQQPLLPKLFRFKPKVSTQFRNVVPNFIILIILQDPNYHRKQTDLLFIFARTYRVNNSLGLLTLLLYIFFAN
jgi:hypothetical protein